MAVTTSWKVEIGSIASPTDFSSRVMSMNINQSVDVNVIGRGMCVITMLNKDGALTPGGGGTYSSTDWFSQGLYVTAIVSGSPATVFHGVIVDFDLKDDGVFSTVTITAMDGLTVAARTLGSIIQSDAAYLTYYNDLIDRYGIVFPLLGQATAEGMAVSEFSGTQPTVGLAALQPAIRPITYADSLQQYLIPSVNDVTWATDITITGAGVTQYNVISLGSTTTRSAANQLYIDMVPTASISSTELPFDDVGFVQAFNNDTLITQAQVQGSFTGSTSQTSTASTNATYGNRSVQYTTTLHLSDSAALATAQLLTNRYSTSRFDPVEISVNASQVKQYANDLAATQWRKLLAISTGLWQRIAVTWKGSGANTQTDYVIIKGRRISVTPSDTRVTFTCGNWSDNHGFILNTDRLDYDRLG